MQLWCYGRNAGVLRLRLRMTSKNKRRKQVPCGDDNKKSNGNNRGSGVGEDS